MGKVQTRMRRREMLEGSLWFKNNLDLVHSKTRLAARLDLETFEISLMKILCRDLDHPLKISTALWWCSPWVFVNIKYVSFTKLQLFGCPFALSKLRPCICRAIHARFIIEKAIRVRSTCNSQILAPCRLCFYIHLYVCSCDIPTKWLFCIQGATNSGFKDPYQKCTWVKFLSCGLPKEWKRSPVSIMVRSRVLFNRLYIWWVSSY